MKESKLVFKYEDRYKRLTIAEKERGDGVKERKKMRTLLMVAGICLIGFAVSLMRIANLGTDAFTTLNLGFSFYSGIPFGLFQAFTNTILLIFIFFMDKKYIGIGTVVNMLGVGFISDLFSQFLQPVFVNHFSIFLRILIMGIALVLASMGAGLYMSSDLGIAPYDALALIIEKKVNRNIPFKTWRAITDILCVASGFLLGSTVGIGTVAMAFLTGPLIAFFKRFFSSKYSQQPIYE